MGLCSRFFKRFFAAVDCSHNCAGGFTGADLTGPILPIIGIENNVGFFCYDSSKGY